MYTLSMHQCILNHTVIKNNTISCLCMYVMVISGKQRSHGFEKEQKIKMY